MGAEVACSPFNAGCGLRDAGFGMLWFVCRVFWFLLDLFEALLGVLLSRGSRWSPRAIQGWPSSRALRLGLFEGV